MKSPIYISSVTVVEVALKEQIMPEASFVGHSARTLYGIEPDSIESLDQYQHDWRGIYRVQNARDGTWWLLRLSHASEQAWLAQVAGMVDWLSQRYPTPSVRPTSGQQLVGTLD